MLVAAAAEVVALEQVAFDQCVFELAQDSHAAVAADAVVADRHVGDTVRGNGLRLHSEVEPFNLHVLDDHVMHVGHEEEAKACASVVPLQAQVAEDVAAIVGDVVM